MNSTAYAVDEYGNEAKDIRSGYVGEFKKFGFAGVPKHCLACDGSEISRATYSELFEVFGETYGAGDGETTFNLPDFRGAFLRCIGGNAAALGEQQGDAIRNIAGHAPFRAYRGVLTSNNQTLFNGEGAIRHVIGEASIGGSEGPQGVAYGTGSNWGNENLSFDTSRVVPTAAENRPINYAVNICVVYE